MSYQLNKTDGSILVDLIDGKIDTSSTNLALVGRGYRGYGEVFNENFIKLLENFANTAAPSNPLAGQIWWDTATDKLKIYTGTQWKSNAEPYVQATEPSELLNGEFWFNNRDKQLFFSDGGNPVLIGPSYTTSQGKSGLFIENITSIDARTFPVVKLFIGGIAVGVFSDNEFTPDVTQRVEELVTDQNPQGIIFKGFNVFDKDNFRYVGTAESATKILQADGTFVTADQIVRADQNTLTTGNFEVRNQNGIVFSTPASTYVNMRPQGANFFIENQLANSDLALRVRSSAFQGSIVNGIYIDASEGRVGIFNNNRLPAYTMDVEGDMRVTGNLLVEGEQLSVEVTTLQVLDKSIKLAVTADGDAEDDAVAAGGGVILRSDDGDKTITWELPTNSWTFNKSVDLSDAGTHLSIAGSTKLTDNTLENIAFAEDLVRIGTLEFLNVDALTLDGNKISAATTMTVESNAADGNGFSLFLDLAGNVRFTTPRQIKNVLEPELAGDVSNKKYVDDSILQSPIVLTFDVTGLDVQAGFLQTLAGFIDDLVPADAENIGKIARIHTYSYSDVEINIEAAKNVSTVAVDANGTLNQPVVRDIAFSNIQFANPDRQLLEYRVELVDPGTGIPIPQWTHQDTTSY